MKYVLAAVIIAVLGVALGALSSPDVAAWEPPEDCEDEDRTIAGNRNSPCKVVVPDISHVEYQVRMIYPRCVEEILIHMPGSTAPEESTNIRIFENRQGEMSREEIWEWGVRGKWIRDGHVLVQGKIWGLQSQVGSTSAFGNPRQDRPNLSVYVGYASSGSNWAERPRTDAVAELVNACLDLVRQEGEDREHQAAVEKAEAEAAARIAAQKDADEKAEVQAQRDAESQARIAAQELAAAQESKRRIAATELLKTQTLETQIEHEEVVAGILREIVRIRLAGQEDRARITNEYMTRAEATAASFEEETVETEARIQAYLDFNVELLTRLEEYQADIGARLERVKASIEEQQANIDRLEREAQELVAREEGTGELNDDE